MQIIKVNISHPNEQSPSSLENNHSHFVFDGQLQAAVVRSATGYAQITTLRRSHMNPELNPKFQELGRRIPFLVILFILAPALFACQKMVEKEHMDAIGNWSIAMCKCAEKSDAAEAKSCADALKKPQLELLNSSGRTKYKLESVHAHGSIESTGAECQMKIMAR